MGFRDCTLAASGFGLYWLYTGAFAMVGAIGLYWLYTGAFALVGAIGFNLARSVMKLSMVAEQPGIGGHFY